jgi:hypothetical protein
MAGKLSRANVWYYHMGLDMKGKCLCCNDTEIVYNAHPDDEDYWHKGHIIHKKDAGPDIYENIRPICVKCNIADKGFKTSYHYMATIRKDLQLDVEHEVDRIKLIATKYLNKPSILKCKIIIYDKNSEIGIRCNNNKMPRSTRCGIHENSRESLLAEEQERQIKLGILTDRTDRDDPKDPNFINDNSSDEKDSKKTNKKEKIDGKDKKKKDKDDDQTEEVSQIINKNKTSKKIITTRSVTSKIKETNRAMIAITSDDILVSKKEMKNLRDLVASLKRSIKLINDNEKLLQLSIIIDRIDSMSNITK